MKKVIERTRPARVLGVYYVSPGKRMGVYNESIVVKTEFEVTMDVRGERLSAYRACQH